VPDFERLLVDLEKVVFVGAEGSDDPQFHTGHSSVG
jgi:hypothetical protein